MQMRSKASIWLPGFIGVLAVSMPANLHAAARFTVVGLGSIQGSVSTSVHPLGLNDNGTVVGFQADPGSSQGFIWSAQTGMVSVGDYILHDVNNAGISAGQTNGSSRAIRRLANGNIQIIGGFNSVAQDINASGAIAGWSNDPWPPHGFMWTEGGGTTIAAIPPQSATFNAINASSVAAGGYNRTAATWSAATGWRDLATPFGDAAMAFALNDSGMVAGTATLGNFASQGVVWDATGAATAIGGLNGILRSELWGINNGGTAVGHAFARAGLGDQRAVKWTAAGGLQDLNTLIDPQSGWTLLTARDINASGQIIGQGRDPFGFIRGYILNPISVSPPTGAIPEPGTWAMLIAGFGVVGASLRRRRVVAA